MSKEHGELNARADNCIMQARQAMDVAEQLPESGRAEYLKVAEELLKLASEIRAFMSFAE